MKPLERSLPFALAAAALILGASGARAEGPAAGWQGQVSATVSSWAASGNLDALKAGIRDVCSENPGVALDVVAYAGQLAVNSNARCAVSSPDCPALDDMLAALYDQVLVLSAASNRTTGPSGAAFNNPSSRTASGKSPAATNQMATTSGPAPAPGGGSTPPIYGGTTPKPDSPPTCQSIGLCGADPKDVSPTRVGR